MKNILSDVKSIDRIGTGECEVINAYPDGTNLSNVCLFCDYIFLDTDERRRFAQVSHEYLIEQVQTLSLIHI